MSVHVDRICEGGSVIMSPPLPVTSLPGVKKALGHYGPAGVEDCTGAGGDSKDDDDDIDLFGSEDEEVTNYTSCLTQSRPWMCSVAPPNTGSCPHPCPGSKSETDVCISHLGTVCQTLHICGSALCDST